MVIVIRLIKAFFAGPTKEQYDNFKVAEDGGAI